MGLEILFPRQLWWTEETSFKIMTRISNSRINEVVLYNYSICIQVLNTKRQHIFDAGDMEFGQIITIANYC